MNDTALDAHLQRERVHAAVSFRLDDALGTHHGISWSDMVLMQLLDEANVATSLAQMADRLSVLQSELLRRVRPLEKTGLVSHAQGGADKRAMFLSDAGRRRLAEARETAARVCAKMDDLASDGVRTGATAKSG